MKSRHQDRYKIAAKKNSGRPNLENIYLDVEKGECVATTGEILARVPVEIEPGDTSGLIPPDAIRYAYNGEISKVGNEIIFISTKTKQPVEMVSPGTKFVDVEGVWPKDNEEKVSLTINAGLLQKLAKALDTDELTLTFRPGSSGPIIVTRLELVGNRFRHTSDGAIGLIVPIIVH